MVKEIDALARGLQVYRLLKRSGPLGLSAIARQSGLPKASVLRILVTLQSAGFARRRLTDRQWQVAGAISGDERHARLAEVAGPVLDDLCHRVLWPSDVGVYEDGAIRVLETSRSLSPFLVNRDITQQDIHVLPSAMGRAILAWSSPARQAAILRDLAARPGRHDRPARDPALVEKVIHDTLARGYARRVPGYFVSTPREANVTAVALPVIARGEAVAAINLSWVSSALSEADFETRHLAALQEAARVLSERLERSTVAPASA